MFLGLSIGRTPLRNFLLGVVAIAMTPSLIFTKAVREIARLCRQATRAFGPFGGLARFAGMSFRVSLSETLLIALTMILIPVAANANGNMVDSFTYTGNQPGFTNGAVYALSAANTELNVCLFTPVSGTTPPSLQYTPSCQNTLAPSNSNSYSAIAYLGTANNPSNYFAVGDNAGNIFLMQIQFNSGNPNPIAVNSIQKYTFNNVDSPGKPCGKITSLAVEPQGQYLFISCVGNDLEWYMSPFEMAGPVGAVLGLAPINSDGTLGSITTMPPIPLGVCCGYWGNKNLKSVSKVTAGVYAPGTNISPLVPKLVNPKLRVYPPGFPALANTPYASSGAVFYSGIISGYNANSSGFPVVNTGLICRAGVPPFPPGHYCQIAYNIETSKSVFTAAEYGVDKSGNVTLYWNQIFQEAGIFVKNAIASCQFAQLWLRESISSTPCVTQNNLQWPPANVPSSTIWVDQLIFSPTPAAVASNTSYTQGLLQMSAWNNGYLAYYDVAAGSYVPGVFMSNNGSNGEVGANVQGLTTDSNGNLLIQAGSSGLLGFNPFPTSSTNIETQTDVTYVPIPADNKTNCGAVCIVNQALTLSSFVVSVISLAENLDDDGFANHNKYALDTSGTASLLRMSRDYAHFKLIEPDALNSGANDSDRSIMVAMNTDSSISSDVFARGKSDAEPALFQLAGFSAAAPPEKKQCCDPNPNAPGSTLALLLGQKAYWATFTYSEDQVKLMGAFRGAWIKGLQLRLAEGVSAEPKENTKFDTLQIGLNSDGSKGNGNKYSPYGSTVFKGSMCVARESYDRTVDGGYGPMISFDSPYHYLGGDLTVAVLHSGSQNPKRFYLDAFGGAGVRGAYAQLASVQSMPSDITHLNVAPRLRFSTGGAGAGNRKPASISCN